MKSLVQGHRTMAESIRGQTLSREGEEEAQRPAPFFGEVILEAAILTPLREVMIAPRA
jgi:hypothetical protein